jgi:anti-sigma B factor antagonist
MFSPLRRPYASGEITDRVTVVRFDGKVCMNDDHCQSMQDLLLDIAGQPDRGPVVLDMGNVTAVSSLALGALVKLHKGLSADGRPLTLCNLSPEVYEVFAVTRLDTVLDLRPAQPGIPQEGV